MRRTGLGRHGGLDSGAGDPLDGLVNLFDIGIVLAVAFLLAGLGLTLDAESGEVEPRETITVPEQAPQVEGRGDAVGTVYRLPDGRLVLVRP
jgi:hypothetical protein